MGAGGGEGVEGKKKKKRNRHINEKTNSAYESRCLEKDHLSVSGDILVS